MTVLTLTILLLAAFAFLCAVGREQRQGTMKLGQQVKHRLDEGKQNNQTLAIL